MHLSIKLYVKILPKCQVYNAEYKIIVSHWFSDQFHNLTIQIIYLQYISYGASEYKVIFSINGQPTLKYFCTLQYVTHITLHD